jgi:RNA recognition motif-containing protein
MTIYIGNLSYRATEEDLKLDGAEWMGRPLRVNKAKPKEEGNRGAGIKRNDGY